MMSPLWLWLVLTVMASGAKAAVNDNANSTNAIVVSSRGGKLDTRAQVKYLILASEVLRPNTVYKVVVISLPDSTPSLMTASVSRNGVALARNQVLVGTNEASHVLLKIPSDNSNGSAEFKLRVEGESTLSGQTGIVFEEEKVLRFSRKFLSITISTNRVVFNAEQTIRIRVLMLTTSMKPYNGIVDLFLIDPDGYVIKKWNSKELNVGVLTQSFQLPLYPKVGFWQVRVQAETQIEELPIKVEKHYLPMYELVVFLPSFVLHTEEFIEATVSGSFIIERIAKGNVTVTWMAKKVDLQTAMFNDSVLFREEYEYASKVSNLYHNSLYSTLDGGNHTHRVPSVFFDSFANSSFAPKRPIVENWTLIRTDFRQFSFQTKNEPFILFLDEVEALMGQKERIQIRAEASLTEYFYNKTELAFADTRIIRQSLFLRFLGSSPFAFKPGMIFQGQIAVLYDNFVPLDKYTLNGATLLLQPYALLDTGEEIKLKEMLIPSNVIDNSESGPQETFGDLEEILSSLAIENSVDEFRDIGVDRFQFDTPHNAIRIKIAASFTHPEVGEAFAELTAYEAISKTKSFLYVLCSTKRLRVGSYAIFHVKTTFPTEHIDWVIISKDIILLNGRELGENIHPEVLTFSVVVSPEMSPGFHMMVYAIISGEIVSDSLFMPVETIKHDDIEFSTNQVKDHLQNTVEVTCRGLPGSTFLVSTLREFLYPAQGLYALSKTNIMNSLYELEEKKFHLQKIVMTSREGETFDEILFYPSNDNEIDTERGFATKNLIMFSNVLVPSSARFAHECNSSAGERPCLSEGCFHVKGLCNGVRDCQDGYDERDCKEDDSAHVHVQQYRLSRQSRFEDFYDLEDGDWGWIDTNIDQDGEQFITLKLPPTPDDFFFTAFSISKENGISLLKLPVSYSTTRPVDFYCETPDVIRRGECFGLLCSLLNRSPYELEATVILYGSEDYSFIHVEDYGYVTSYAPRLSQGDHHHFVWLRPETEQEVRLPISPHVEQGTLTVTVQLVTQITTITKEIEIEIIPEGSTVYKHTSVLLDLKNRANVLRFMKIGVDETPIIPYEVFRRFVSGSPKAHLTISGDAIGPVFPNDEPVSFESMFNSGHGRFGKGTEYHAFNLAANTWQLHYLRLTNQLLEKKDLAKTVFAQMNVEYTALMRRFSGHGWFANWDNAAPSVWLTAWVIRLVSHVSFQDWEDYIYIDPMVITTAVVWLLNFQSSDGSFLETQHYRSGALHEAVNPGNSSNRIALTAHVLITLEETAFLLQGKSKQYSATSRQRAINYLERRLPHNDDGFDITISTYALALCKSSLADLAYGKMLSLAREEDGMTYWSRTPIKTNRVRYEFNRPFLEGKDHQSNDALSVEGTAYALLTIFLVEGGGVTFVQEKIVQWLNTMRQGDGGFVSSVDTIVTLQALVVYSYNSRIKDITDLTVNVDLPDSNITESYHINGENIANGEIIDVTNVWGHVNLFAQGAGQAVAQLNLQYGVDYEPFKDQPARDCFKLSVTEFFSGRNKSEVVVRSCFSWTLTSVGATSGMAMLVIDTPSGYLIEQYEANSVVRKREVPEMRDADTLQPGKTIWYFDRVPNETRCFEHTIKRYFPVANLTRTRHAVILEPLRPEHFFVRTFNATSLYILSICEVCGSYQCPYCPFYSCGSAHSLSIFATLLIVVRMFLPPS